jgi:hypothetical protein
MSTLSNYLPVDQDDSLPINSYLSFDITGNNNPDGYNSSTGIYTHPDGTYWLKTGVILPYVSPNTTNYPKATYVAAVGTSSGSTSTNKYTDNFVSYVDSGNGDFIAQHYGPTNTCITKYNITTGQGSDINTNNEFPRGNGMNGGVSYDTVNNYAWIFYRYNDENNSTKLKLASYNYSTGANVSNDAVYAHDGTNISLNVPYGIVQINSTPEFVVWSKQNGTEKMQIYDMSGSSPSLVSTTNVSLYGTYNHITLSDENNKFMLWDYSNGKYVEFQTSNFTATGTEITNGFTGYANTYRSLALDPPNMKVITNKTSYYNEYYLVDYIGRGTEATDSITGKTLFQRIA